MRTRHCVIIAIDAPVTYNENDVVDHCMTCWMQHLSPELQNMLINELGLEKEYANVRTMVGMLQDVHLPPLLHESNRWALSYHQPIYGRPEPVPGAVTAAVSEPPATQSVQPLQGEVIPPEKAP